MMHLCTSLVRPQVDYYCFMELQKDIKLIEGIAVKKKLLTISMTHCKPL